MGYFDKIADLGLLVVCRRNMLGSTTMVAVRPGECDDYGGLDVLIDLLPEWRVVDFSNDDAHRGAKMLYEKLTVTGSYATWDERWGHRCTDESSNDLLIGFEHRPECDRFQTMA